MLVHDSYQDASALRVMHVFTFDDGVSWYLQNLIRPLLSSKHVPMVSVPPIQKTSYPDANDLTRASIDKRKLNPEEKKVLKHLFVRKSNRIPGRLARTVVGIPFHSPPLMWLGFRQNSGRATLQSSGCHNWNCCVSVCNSTLAGGKGCQQ